MTVQRSPTELDMFTADWEAWHLRKDALLAHEHGFLAVTGLHWPASDPQRFPDAPGTWSTGVDGTTVRGRHAFGVIPERGGVNAVWGDAVIEVARRGGHDVIRPRHPGHPLRTAFTGNRATNLPCAYTDFATCPLPPAENRLPVAIEAGEKIVGARSRVRLWLARTAAPTARSR